MNVVARFSLLETASTLRIRNRFQSHSSTEKQSSEPVLLQTGSTQGECVHAASNCRLLGDIVLVCGEAVISLLHSQNYVA